MTIVLADAATYSMNKAKETIAGYCLAMRPSGWKAPKGTFGPPPTETHVPIWAYGSYDSLPGWPTPEPGDIDLFIAGGLNARIESKAYSTLNAVAGEAFAALANVPDERAFWELDIQHVLDPPENSDSWHRIGRGGSWKVLWESSLHAPTRCFITSAPGWCL